MELKEYVSKNRKKIQSYREYFKKNDWTQIVVEKWEEESKNYVLNPKATVDKKASEFKYQTDVIKVVYKRLKWLTKTYYSERKQSSYVTFLNLCLSIINSYTDTADNFVSSNLEEDLDYEYVRNKELQLEDLVFEEVSELREKLSDIDISTESESGLINFHADKKAPLILHEKLSVIYPQINTKLKEMGIKFDLDPPQTFHIHEKKPPVWDLEKHYFDQDPKVLQYWINELNKCKNGIMVEGVYFSGWMYFQINHFVTLYPSTIINPKTGEEESKKVTGVPPLRDNEWWIMNDNYEEAKAKNKMIFLAATRRAAKTTLNTSHIGWSVISGKHQILLASGSTKDLGQIRDMFEILEQNITPAFRWVNLVNDWSLFVDIGIKNKDGKNVIGSRIKVVNLDGGSGSKSELLAGFAPDAAIIDEIMKLPFKKQLGALKPALAGGGSKNLCVVILSGTSGNSELAQDAFDYLREPETYDVLPMNWELFNSRVPEEYRTWKERPFGTFLPGQMSTKTGIFKTDSNLAVYLGKTDSKILKSIPIKITDWKQSLEVIKTDRKRLEKDIVSYTQEVLYHPICPSDMLLSGKVNPFPLSEAISHRERLKAEGGRGIKCFLTQDPATGKIEHTLSNNPLADYPYKGGYIDSPIILYEPIPKEKPMDYLYVSGFDDYKLDEAGTDSVGSFHIYKVDVGLDKYCGRIVASYASRPDPHGKLHRQIYLLQQAFNAKCLMENADVDYKTYLENKRVADLWLQETLDFDSDMTRQGTNRRKYGWTPTPKNKKNLFSQFTNYCKREFEIYNEEGDSISVLGVELIDDIGLLDEIIAYSEDNNVDRITSAMSCLGYEQYLYANYLLPNINKQIQQKREENRKIVKKGGGFFTGGNRPTKIFK